MKNAILGTVLVTALACGPNESSDTSSSGTAGSSSDAPVIATASPDASGGASEKTHRMKATIVSRDAAKNTLLLDNENVPGVMAAMKMDYELREAKVDSTPPDGTKVEVVLHELNGSYWVTGVKPQ